MSKIVGLFLWVCTLSLFGAPIQYEYEHEFVLKKDEIGIVLLTHKEVSKKPTADNPNNEYMMKFRWTLFTNNMLTLLVNYRGYPTQYVLERKTPLKAVMIPLLPEGENRLISRTNLYIFFTEFDEHNKTAKLDVAIEDNAQRVDVEFKPKKK